MKKFLTLVAMCAITIAADAQIVSSSSRRITTETKIFSNYNRIAFSYTPMTFSGDVGKELETISGISLGWIGGWSVSKTVPVYIESGISVKYNWGTIYKYGGSGEKSKLNYLGLVVPLNVSYKYSIPGTDGLSLAPYAGLHLTGNLLAKEKYTDYYGESQTIDWFDDDDVYDTAKRIQFGWQAGLGMNYKALYLGVGYAGEFTKFMDDINTGGLTVSLGYNF